jgi:hypothetical protein
VYEIVVVKDEVDAQLLLMHLETMFWSGKLDSTRRRLDICLPKYKNLIQFF